MLLQMGHSIVRCEAVASMTWGLLFLCLDLVNQLLICCLLLNRGGSESLLIPMPIWQQLAAGQGCPTSK